MDARCTCKGGRSRSTTTVPPSPMQDGILTDPEHHRPDVDRVDRSRESEGDQNVESSSHEDEGDERLSLHVRYAAEACHGDHGSTIRVGARRRRGRGRSGTSIHNDQRRWHRDRQQAQRMMLEKRRDPKESDCGRRHRTNGGATMMSKFPLTSPSCGTEGGA